MSDEQRLIGIDECNFSPSLAGDCVVCAYYPLDFVEGVRDSKKVPHKQQLALFEELQQKGLYAIALANVNSIQAVNISKPRYWAIRSAFDAVTSAIWDAGQEKDFTFRVVIDGYWPKEQLKDFKISFELQDVWDVQGIIRADETVYAVSAASIVARVYADALFEGWNAFWSGYNINKCHGSPDQKMYDALRQCQTDGKPFPPMFRRGAYGKSWWQKILGEK